MCFVIYFFAAEGFTKAYFGQINATTTKFFEVGIETVDWFTLTSSVSCGLVMFLMAFPASSNKFKMRRECLISTVSLMCAFLFLVSAWLIHVRNRFIFVIMGQIFSGGANAVNWIVSGVVASTWFSEERLLGIIALAQAGRDCGHLWGFLIPSSTLSTVNGPPIGNASEKENLYWSSDVSLAMAATFSSVLAATVLLGFSCFVLVHDPPPHDSRNEREYAVARVADVGASNESNPRTQENSARKLKFWKILSNATSESIPAWYKATKCISNKRRFVALILPFSVIEAMNITWFILSYDMISAIPSPDIYTAAVSKSPELFTYHPPSITKPELAMTLLSFGSMVSGLITGKAAGDIRSKSYRSHVYVLLAGGSGMTLIVTTLFLYFHMLYNCFIAILIFMFTFGVFMSMTRIMIIAMILRNYSDVSSIVLICWMNMSSSIMGFLIPMCGRQIFNTCGTFGVMVLQLVQSSVVLLSFLFM